MIVPVAPGRADDGPTAPGLRNLLVKLDYHSGGAQVAMTQMMRGPGNTLWAVRERLSLNDLRRLAGACTSCCRSRGCSSST